jgi:hypothetical protein
LPARLRRGEIGQWVGPQDGKRATVAIGELEDTQAFVAIRKDMVLV